MKNSILILITILLFMINSFAQEKGIYLINKKDKDSIFLSEDHRIRILTKDDQRIVGWFKIVDEKSIIIKDVVVPIDSILTIRRASIFQAIADPVAIAFGGSLTFVGLILISSGGMNPLFGFIMLVPGIPTLLIPIIKNNHNSKNWDCKIKN